MFQMVFKVTGFPAIPTDLAAFLWIDGRGSYWLSIYQMDEWCKVYKPIYAAFDASGVQNGFDELAFAQRGVIVESVQVQTNKMRMVVALKLILGRQLLLMPKSVFWSVENKAICWPKTGPL